MHKNYQHLTEVVDRFEEIYGRSELSSLQMPVYGRHFSEALLQGMIRATEGKPRAKPTEAERLSTAFKAIYGNRPDICANERGADYHALSWMAEMREMQEQEKEQGLRQKIESNSRLAERAAAFGHDTSTANHLRGKFPKFLAERAKKDLDKEVEVEVVQRFALALIEDILKMFGVPFFAYE